MNPSTDRMPRWLDVLIAMALGVMFVLCTFENHSRVGRLISAGFVLAAIYTCLYIGRLSAKSIRSFVECVLLIYAAIIVSSFYSIEKLYSFKNFLYYQHFWFGLLFLGIGMWATTPRRQVMLLIGLSITGFVSAVFGLIVLYKGSALVKAGWIDQLTDFVYKAQDPGGHAYYRAKGMLESYTKSASVFILALPSMVALFVMQARRRRIATSVLIVFAAAISLWFLMATKSRGAWIGAAVACTGTLMLLKGRWWIPVVAIVAVVLAVVAVPSLRQRVQSLIVDASSPDLLFSGRFELWRQGLKPIRERPLTGIGYGGNIFLTDRGLELYELRSAGFRQPDLHNVYLQTLAEVGVIGFAAYLLFTVVLLRCGFSSARSQFPDVMPGLAVALPAFIGMLIFGFVYYFNERHIANMLAAVLGMIPASLFPPEKIQEPRR